MGLFDLFKKKNSGNSSTLKVNRGRTKSDDEDEIIRIVVRKSIARYYKISPAEVDPGLEKEISALFVAADLRQACIDCYNKSGEETAVEAFYYTAFPKG